MQFFRIIPESPIHLSKTFLTCSISFLKQSCFCRNEKKSVIRPRLTSFFPCPLAQFSPLIHFSFEYSFQKLWIITGQTLEKLTWQQGISKD